VIRCKLNQPQYGEFLFEDVRIVGFLDCKINETCTPGTSLMNDEEWVERRPGAEIIQRALYSGYLNVCVLKVVMVVFPNEIIAYLYGPVSARENDIGLLNLSWLNEHLVALNQRLQRLGQMVTICFISPCKVSYSPDKGLKLWP